MTEADIQVFIDGVKRYFENSVSLAAQVSTPYLVNSTEAPAEDFTGIIGVSGGRKGCVYFSAPRAMLQHLLLGLGEPTVTSELMRDLVGEVANTVSGNARAVFGSDFMISVPVVVQGRPENLQLPKQLKAFVVPFQWQSYSAMLVVCLE